MTTATKRPQHDAARAAYRRSREAEKWVAGYVQKMVAWPGPDFHGAVESVGAKKAAQMMREEDEANRQYCHNHAPCAR